MSGVELKGLRGLQGLDDLLSDIKEEAPKQNILNVSVNTLTSGKYQPRTDIDATSLHDLALSIKSQGIIQPLIVRNTSVDHYEIIAGERRWRAAIIAGLKEVPIVIRNVSDETALAFALIENIQREGLNPIDEAASLLRLKEEFAMTHEEVAERVGRSRSAVTNMIRLLLLHPDVKALLRAGKIEMGHARALLSLEIDIQLATAKKIVEENMSVRNAEQLVQKIKCPPPILLKRQPSNMEEKINNWSKILSEKLSSNVKISLNTKGEGRVVIQIHSPDEIELLIASLKEK